MDRHEFTFFEILIGDIFSLAKVIGEATLHRIPDGSSAGSYMLLSSPLEEMALRDKMYRIRQAEKFLQTRSPELAKVMQIKYLEYKKQVAEAELKALRGE